jgi:GT2 family glycosyltransferase
MTLDRIRVAIVAPVHNRRELTLQCLKSLSRLNSDGLEIVTIIVDDGSTDGTADSIRAEFPDVRIVAGNGELWFTEGTNVGVRASMEYEPKYVLMINDDQVFDPRFLQYMVETAEKFPRSVVGSLLLLWDRPHKLFQTAPVWDTLKGGWRHWSHQTVWTVPDKPWSVDLIVGNCLLVPAAAIEECGLMDAKRFPNFGDAEYTPRLKRAGWQLLIDPRARVFCQPNNIPERIRNKTLRKLFVDLVVDLKNVHNLRRRLYANLLGGPNKVAGLTAFIAFLVNAAMGRNVETTRWADANPEPPLKQVFASRVVDE